jgi:predicted esterase
MRSIVVLATCLAVGCGSDPVPTDPVDADLPRDDTTEGDAPEPNADADGSGSVDAPASDAAGDGSDDVTGDVGDGGDGGPTAGSAGCGKAGTPIDGTLTLTVAGKARTFIVHAPKTYDTTKPYPLIFGFHGATRSAADFDNDRGAYKFGPAVGARAILVYPNALAGASGATSWTRDVPDDLAFFDAMLAKVSAELCVDRGRIFATGHSSGGFFSNTLGCQRGDVLRAIAPVAGGGGFRNCKGQVAVWLAHGTKDTEVPIASGRAARDHFVSANGCGATGSPTTPAPCVAYPSCKAGFPVHWCEHDEPTYGSPPTYHGWPSFATSAIVAFFEGL